MTEIDPEEQELRRRMAENGPRELGVEFARHHDRLWRMVHFRIDPRLTNRVDADDVLQEAYLEAAKRLHHFLENENMTIFIWLRLIVGQTLIDIHRRHLEVEMRSANREISIFGQQLPLASTVSLAAILLGNATSPSRAAMRQELSDKLEEAIEQMSPIDREILTLRHFEELTNSEVAQALGIEQKAASIRYVRALKRLRDILEEYPDFQEE